MSLAVHEEDKLAAHLDRLDQARVNNVIAHSDIAHDDNHPHQNNSVTELAKWAAGILGVPVTAGLGFKVAKFIRRIR